MNLCENLVKFNENIIMLLCIFKELFDFDTVLYVSKTLAPWTCYETVESACLTSVFSFCFSESAEYICYSSHHVGLK